MFTRNIQLYTILKPIVGKGTVCLNKLVLQHKQLANKQSDLPSFDTLPFDTVQDTSYYQL